MLAHSEGSLRAQATMPCAHEQLERTMDRTWELVWSRAGTWCLLALASLAAGCADAPTTSRTQRERAAPRELATATIRDVPASRVELPPQVAEFQADSEKLQSALDESGRLAFVAFKNPTSERIVERRGMRSPVSRASTRAAVERLSANGVEVLQLFGGAALALVRVPRALFTAMRSDSLVDFIEPVPRLRSATQPIAMDAAMSLRVGAPTMNSGGSQVTPWNVSLVNAPSAWYQSTGSAARIMLLGTGVFPASDNPAIPGGNCAGYDNACNSNFLDGNFQLGILAARDNTVGVVGVAPGIPASNIFVWRMFDQWGYPDVALYYAGLNSAIEQSMPIVLVGFVHYSQCAGEATLVGALIANGSVIVAPVGDRAIADTLLYPAGFADVVAVAGVREDGSSASGSISGCGANRSQVGTFVPLAGPFYAYTTSYSGTYDDTRATYGYCSNVLAAAHVAGILALARTTFPTWSMAGIVNHVYLTASNGGSTTTSLGYGIPNGCSALQNPLTVVVSGPSQLKSGGT